jgi:hypothetical protein
MLPYSRPGFARLRTFILGLLVSLLSVLGLIQLAPTAAAASELTFGSPMTLAFPKPKANTELTFAASAGEKINLKVTAATLTNSFFYGKGIGIELVRPDGTRWNMGAVGSVTTLTSPLLDATGTWTLRFLPQTDVVGKLTFVATKPVDLVRPITPGTPVTVTYPGDGVDVRLTFPVTAGRRFTLSLTDSQLTFPYRSGTVGAALISPAGVVTQIPAETTTSMFYEHDGWLDEDGTWTVRLQAFGDIRGTQQVLVGVVADPTAPVSLDEAFTVGSMVPGQNAVYRFHAEAGRTLEAFLDQPEFATGSWGGSTEDSGVKVSLYGPDGDYQRLLLNPGWTYGQEVDLPETGDYTIKVDPVSDTVGTARLTLRYPVVRSSDLILDKSVTVGLTRGDHQRVHLHWSDRQTTRDPVHERRLGRHRRERERRTSDPPSGRINVPGHQHHRRPVRGDGPA